MSSDLPRLNDYTRAYRQPKKMYDLLGLKIRRGYYIGGGIAALLSALIAGGLVAGVLLLITGGNLFMVGWGIIVGIGAGIAAYVVMTVRLRGTTTLWQLAVTWVWGTFFQPSVLSGLGRDRQPNDVHWQVILWAPTDQSWHRARELAQENARLESR